MRRHSRIRPKRPEWLCIQENGTLIQINAEVGRKSLFVLQDRRHWGLRLFYREAGGSSKPTIVLLHGFPSYQFHDLIPLLGDRFHVVAPDYPGLGFSEAPPTDCPAIDILNLAVEAHGGLKRWSVLGAAPGPSYASDYRDVDGIIFPTKRRVYAYEGDYQLVKEPLLVKIDMAEITLAYSSFADV